jgi:hypothetical protein
MNKKTISMLALLSLIAVPAYAQAVDNISHAKIVAFVFFTGLIFACIPGALLTGFKLSLKYNILMGFALSGLIFWLSYETHTSLFYSINLTLALLSGWLLSNYLLYKLILKQLVKP